MKNNDRRKTPKRISNLIDYLVVRCIKILWIMCLLIVEVDWFLSGY